MDVLILLVNKINCQFYKESIEKRFSFKVLYLILRWEKFMGSMYFVEIKYKIGDDLV